MAGLAVPGFSTSLAYYDTYRRENVPANLVQVESSIAAVLEPDGPPIDKVCVLVLKRHPLSTYLACMAQDDV